MRNAKFDHETHESTRKNAKERPRKLRPHLIGLFREFRSLPRLSRSNSEFRNTACYSNYFMLSFIKYQNIAKEYCSRKIRMDKILITYDKETDVLYLSFGKPRIAEAEELETGIFGRFEPGTQELVGLTITNFSQKFSTLRKTLEITSDDVRAFIE